MPSKEFLELISSTVFGGVISKNHGKQIASLIDELLVSSMKLGRKDLDLAKEAAHNSETRTPKSKPSAEISELAHSNPELAFRDWVAMAKISIEQPSSASSIAGLKEPSANFGERVRSLNSLPNMEK